LRFSFRWYDEAKLLHLNLFIPKLIVDTYQDEFLVDHIIHMANLELDKHELNKRRNKMTTLSNVQHNIVRGINRTALITKKHSPEILLGLGLVGMVTSAVLGGQGYLKATEVVDESKLMLYHIKRAGDRGMIGDDERQRPYSKDDHDKDLAVAYVQTWSQIRQVIWAHPLVSASYPWPRSLLLMV
jgi:hypothetical protein